MTMPGTVIHRMIMAVTIIMTSIAITTTTAIPMLMTTISCRGRGAAP